jgi:hypothetical protein
MAMVLQVNRVTSSNSSTVPMDTYKQLHHTTNQEDSFHRKIFDKIEEGKRDKNPQKCQQILDDLMKMIKHLTADVNNYNLAFRETRPPFYMQEFQRLTDRIDTLTKARDTLTEYLHELEDQNLETTFPYSSSFNDVHQFQQQLQYSPTISHSARSSPPEKSYYPHKSSISSIHSGTKDTFMNDHSTTITTNDYNCSHRPRSPTLTPSNFIRIHFPNKHTTALAPRSDETLEVALESRASRHSVTNLRAYTPVYMISRQPCSWDITLDRLREKEIELEEKPKLDHSFIRKRFFTLTYCDICHKILLQGLRCLVCGSRIHTRCIHKSHICHIVQRDFYRHIKHLGPDRFNIDRISGQPRSKEQSRSLPRIPLPRPSINTGQGVGKKLYFLIFRMFFLFSLFLSLCLYSIIGRLCRCYCICGVGRSRNYLFVLFFASISV